MELLEAAELQAVEEGPAIGADGRGMIAARERCFELPEIHFDQTGIEPERAAGASHQRDAEQLTEGGEGLLETIPGASSIALRPQVGEQFIPADSGWIVPGDESEYGEKPTSRDGGQERRIFPLDREAAESLEVQDDLPGRKFYRELTRT